MINKFVVAVSGGVDSMVLANLLLMKNQVAALVHINHHTRGMANELEQKLVEDLGRRFGVDVYVFDYYHEEGNFQNSARNFRYEKLVDIARMYSNKIAVAHHLNDQLENCLEADHLVKSKLMKYRTSYKGCYIYRPLLSMLKEDIYQKATDLGIEYNEDESNKTLKYKRNKNREKLKDPSCLFKAQISYIVEASKCINNTICKSDDKLTREELKNKPSNYRMFKLYQLIKAYRPTINIKNKQLESIEKLVDLPKNSRYSLTNSEEIFIGYDIIYILQKNIEIKHESNLKIGENEFNGIKFNSLTDKGSIRVSKVGDKIPIKGGHKKISRLFIDKKVEQPLRKKWPIVLDENNEIIEIPLLWRKNEIN